MNRKSLLKLPFRLLGITLFIIFIYYTFNYPAWFSFIKFIVGLFCALIVLVFNMDIIYDAGTSFMDWYYD